MAIVGPATVAKLMLNTQHNSTHLSGTDTLLSSAAKMHRCFFLSQRAHGCEPEHLTFITRHRSHLFAACQSDQFQVTPPLILHGMIEAPLAGSWHARFLAFLGHFVLSLA